MHINQNWPAQPKPYGRNSDATFFKTLKIMAAIFAVYWSLCFLFFGSAITRSPILWLPVVVLFLPVFFAFVVPWFYQTTRLTSITKNSITFALAYPALLSLASLAEHNILACAIFLSVAMYFHHKTFTKSAHADLARKVRFGDAGALNLWFAKGFTLDDQVGLIPLRSYADRLNFPGLTPESLKALNLHGAKYAEWLTPHEFAHSIIQRYLSGSEEVSLSQINTVMTELIDPRSFQLSLAERKMGSSVYKSVGNMMPGKGDHPKVFLARQQGVFRIFDAHLAKFADKDFMIYAGIKAFPFSKTDLSGYRFYDENEKAWVGYKTPSSRGPRVAEQSEEVTAVAPAPEKDPFALLGVKRSANKAAIDSAYRKLIIRHHPDKFATRGEETRATALETAIEINWAYAECIKLLKAG